MAPWVFYTRGQSQFGCPTLSRKVRSPGYPKALWRSCELIHMRALINEGDAESLWGRRMTVRDPEKSQQCHKYFLQ